VENITNDKAFSIYPNPTSTSITIETPYSVSLSIHNLNGRQLLHQEINKSITTIDVSTFSGGVYLVKMTGDKGLQVGKFIKQ
jgi:hypothetical protein